jgi:voltage-gated potassium channel Kch
MRLVDGKEFPTIGRGLWWAAETVTTVGYGDVVARATPGTGSRHGTVPRYAVYSSGTNNSVTRSAGIITRPTAQPQRRRLPWP